ncbi:MAG: hAT transposon family protein [Sedimenticola sp.]
MHIRQIPIMVCKSNNFLHSEKRKQDQKKYDAKRKRVVKETWLEEYTWAKIDNDELFCDVCREFPDYSDKDASLVKGIRDKYRKETLKYHNKSVKHVKCVEHKRALQNPIETPLSKSIKKLDEKNSVVYEKLFNTAYYVATENEAFVKFPRLLCLQSKNGVDIGKNYQNDMACKDFCMSTAEVLKEETTENIKGARFICILADGSTDKGIVEQELVYVRYVDENGELKTRLCEIVDLEHGDAKGVKAGWLTGLTSVGLCMDSIAEKLVGVNTDGASVNLGKKGGAVKFLLDDINEHLDGDTKCDEYVSVVHCIAHNLELAVCDAKKGCDYLADFERVLKGVFQLYYYSPKRRRELYNIAMTLDQELKHYGGVQQIRWVASQNRALKALLDNYDITLVHLQEITSGGNSDVANKARNYLNEMKTERFLTFLHFMLDWTNVISEVSILFQQKKALICEVGKRVCELKDKVSSMKLRRGKFLKNFLKESENGEFRGKPMTHKQTRLQNDTSGRVKADINELLTAAETFLEERFTKHLEGEPHSLFNAFDFHIWPNKDTSPEEFSTFGDDSIDKLFTIYAPLLTDAERESGSDEWLDLKMYISRNVNRPVVDAYESVLGNQDVDHLKNILPLVKIMLTISPTTAECERGFSKMNQIKTDSRTSLKQSTVSSLMRINLDGMSLEDYKPTQSIVHWLNAGKGTRHTSGHLCPGPRPKKPKMMASSAEAEGDSIDAD